eukprot:TRINITY_DN2461_c1_g1_i5.p1 TRINITY_DN2461_c1_g1~~TRINITY_DN2461_c1_g1_i5.p1  ORF type:complete len:397 (+),score=24.99 TRINITY_DN2461_c1_g1_i5:166-1191(+)
MLGAFVALWILLFLQSWRCRSLLHSVDPSFRLLDDSQVVRRGCLLSSSCDENDTFEVSIPIGSRITFFNFCQKNVVLGDFDLRNAPLQLRSALHAFGAFFSALGYFFQDLSYSTFLVLRFVPICIVFYMAFEALLSCFFGQTLTLSFQITRYYYKRQSCHRYQPFDPRATVLQNFAFSVFLCVGSCATLSIWVEEGVDTECPALWIVPTLSSLLIIVVTQVGVPFSSCPGTFIAGLLVEAGYLSKPLSTGAQEEVALLTYGVFGPIVKPSQQASDDGGQRCSRCCCCSRRRAAADQEGQQERGMGSRIRRCVGIFMRCRCCKRAGRDMKVHAVEVAEASPQ